MATIFNQLFCVACTRGKVCFPSFSPACAGSHRRLLSAAALFSPTTVVQLTVHHEAIHCHMHTPGRVPHPDDALNSPNLQTALLTNFTHEGRQLCCQSSGQRLLMQHATEKRSSARRSTCFVPASNCLATCAEPAGSCAPPGFCGLGASSCKEHQDAGRGSGMSAHCRALHIGPTLSWSS